MALTKLKTVLTLEAFIGPDFLEQIRARAALTEEELVQRAVDFANAGTLRSLVNVQGVAVAADDPYADAAPTGAVRQIQTEFRAALNAVVNGKVTATRAALWRQIAAGVLLVALGGELPTAYRYRVAESFVTEEPTGLFALVLVWLLDPQRPFGAELCQCQLASCGKFFFAVQNIQGRRLTTYCTHQHRLEGGKAKAVARVQKWRKRHK